MSNKPTTTESLIQSIGSFGLYQKLLLMFTWYAVLCWGPFSYSFYFLIAEPRWICVTNSSACNITGSIGPGDTLYDYRCRIERDEWTFVDDYTSLVTQFDLVCDKSVYGKHLNTIYHAGYILGAILAGIVSDRLGRKKILFLSGLFFGGSLLGVALSSSFLMAAIFIFTQGMGHSGAICTAYVLVVEYVGIKHRSIMTNSLFLCYGIGFLIVPGVAYLVREWRLFTLIITLFAVPVFAVYCLVPESLRWMFINKKKKEAIKTLKRIAKINKKSLEDGIELPNIETQASSGDLRLMFKSGLAKDTLIIWYSWFVNSLVYEVVHLSAPDIGGSMYVNWCLTGIAEFLSTLCTIYLVNRFGRKRCIIVCELMAALSAAGSVILTLNDNGNTGYLVGKVVLSMVLAKFFITISYGGIYLLTAEYYPTLIRNVAQGTSIALSATGGIAAGYVSYLIRVYALLPFGVVAVNALFSACLCLSLKETNNQPMLEVLSEEDKRNAEVEVCDKPLFCK